MRIKLKSFSLLILLGIGALTIQSCSALKSCDCPGLGTQIEPQETGHHS